MFIHVVMHVKVKDFLATKSIAIVCILSQIHNKNISKAQNLLLKQGVSYYIYPQHILCVTSVNKVTMSQHDVCMLEAGLNFVCL